MTEGNNPLLIQTPQERVFLDGHLQSVVKAGSEIASESCMPLIGNQSKSGSVKDMSPRSISSSTSNSGSMKSASEIKEKQKFSQSFVDQVKDLTSINYGLFTVFIVFILLHVMPPLTFLVCSKTQRRVLWKVCVTSLLAGVIVYILSLIRVL